MSSIYRIVDPVVVNVANPIPVNTNIFSTPLTIPLDANLDPGNGAMIRLWIGVTTTGGADTALKVIKTNPAGTTPLVNESGFLNAALDFKIRNKGIYWLDLPVIPGCSINLQSTSSPDGTIAGVSIVSVDFLEIQLIIIGA